MRHWLRRMALSMVVLASAGAASAAEPVKVGVLKFGTVAWEVDVIKAHGLDSANGISIEPVELASNDAAKIAFQSGVVDTIVSDVLWAARLRAEGRPVVYAPFSSSEGAIMVAGASPVKSLADLKGKKIGVAGGPLDKSWLLLVGEARRAHGLDLVKEAEPVYGAPPLLQQKLESGELDAALIYWNFAARLEAKGFREVITVGAAAKALGSRGDVAMIGFVFRDGYVAEHPAGIAGLVAASRAAKAILKTSEAEWDRIRPIMKVEDDATFAAMKRRFRAGIPERPAAEEEADAALVYNVLVGLGGEKLVGPAKVLPPGTYWPGLRGG